MKASFAAALVLLFAASGTTLAQTKAASPTASALPNAPPEIGTIKPGLWEMVDTTQAVGVDSRRIVTSRACYSADDVKNVARMLPVQHQMGFRCQTATRSRWAARCHGASPAAESKAR